MAIVPLMRRAVLIVTLTLSFAAILVSAAQAAAPAWKLLAGTGPTNLPPTQSQVDRITVEGDSGSFTVSHHEERAGTPVVQSGKLTFTSGSAVATIVGVTAEAAFAVGDRITLAGLYEYGVEQTVLSCSTDCKTPGSTVTLSEPAAETVSSADVEMFTKELTDVKGAFQVGEEVQGTIYEYFPPGTTVTGIGTGTLMLSKPTGFEYITSEGAVEIATATATSTPVEYDASAQVLQSALEAMPGVGSGSVSVTGGPGGDVEHPYVVAFGGALADQNVQGLSVDGTVLEGEHHAARLVTTTPGGPGTGEIAILPTDVGAAATSGPIEVNVGQLPPGIVVSGPAESEEGGWSCAGSTGPSTIVCSSEVPVPGLHPANGILIPVEVKADAPANANVTVSISGGGAGPATYQMPIVVSGKQAAPGMQAFWAGAFDEDGNLQTQAGAHPASAQTYFLLNTVRSASGQIVPAGEPKNVAVDLPPGFLGNPMATPRCPQSQLANRSNTEGSAACNNEMRIGTFSPILSDFGASSGNFGTGIFNDVPAEGYAAEFTTNIATPEVSIFGSLRSSEDFGVRIAALNTPTYDKVYGAFVVLNGDPAGAHGKALLTNPTACAEEARDAPVASVEADTWQEQGVYSSPVDQILPAVTGCEKLEFTPSFGFQPTTAQGSSGAGATAHLHIPQDSFVDPGKLAQPELKKAVVTLPQGMTLNPSAANGLQACSEEQIGYVGPGALPNPTRFNEAAPSCPDASKLGTVEISSPLLEETLDGTIYLAQQEENPFHSLLAVYLVVDDPRTGIVLKLPGEVKPDPTTGQLTATFDNNPQLPFEELTLHFRGGGPRSELATPEVCGTYKTTGELTPWSAPESGPPAQIEEAGFTVSGSCAASAASRPFAPTFEAGTTNPAAGSYSPLVIKVNRNDGEQELTNLNFTLPDGLLGNLGSVPYCSDAAIEAARTMSGKAEQANPSCPATSQIGTVDTAAGVGSEPIHVGGHVYMAGPYEGAPLSAVVITPAVAGPFDLGDVVVRAPLFVNAATAQISAKSDPIPTILKGIPLKLRSVAITLDRPNFTLNPTSCEAMSISASLASSNGAIATPTNRFQVGGCSSLPFKPTLSASTQAKASKANGASLVLKIAAKPGEANIHKVNLQLPVKLPSRLTTLQKSCTEAQFNANPAGCPAESIIGSATAHTPILQAPLTGPAYLVSHGGAAFPDIEFVLQADERGGDIEIVLDGHTQITKGITYSRFETVPDAPISSFETVLPEGPHSILTAYLPVSDKYNLCGQSLQMPTTLTGQNGAVLKQNTPIAVTGCEPSIKVTKHTVKGDAATIVVSVPSAGKLAASGSGMAGVAKTVSAAKSVALKVKLSKKEQGFLASHRHRKLKLRVKLQFTPKKGAKLSTAVTVLIG